MTAIRSAEPSGEETVVVPMVVPAGSRPEAGDRALLLVLAGPGLGLSFTIGPQPAVLGRGERNEVPIPDGGISRQHATIAFLDGQFILSDLGSANGTFVNGARVTAPLALREADRVQLGPVTLLKFSRLDSLEAEVQRRLHDAAYTDVLTGVGNRRYLERRLREEFAQAIRHRRQLCVLMLDIDHFKQVNDTYGHAGGDLALRALAGRLLSELRAEDVLARYGGEEFVIVARELGPEQGLEFAERLRAALQAMVLELPDGRQLRITVSIGLACLREHGDTNAHGAVARADAALYRAKARGRNRIEFGA